MDVLVVDDEPTNCEVAKVILETAGHRVLVTHNAPEALRLCHEIGTPVDLVLMDIQMPEMSGIEAIMRLRQHPATEETPVLCLSAKVDPQIKDQAMEAGSDNFLEKPYTRSQLLTAIRDTLTRSTNASTGS